METPAAARARRRAEVPPPGSVQQEAALLVDLLSQRGWGAPSGMPSGDVREPAGGADEGAKEEPGAKDEPGAKGSNGTHDCTCGGRTPAACAVCPVCQLIAFVQQVNPETIDKVADFVGFAATALRDLATAQRERQAGTGRDAGARDSDGESTS